MRIAIIGGGWVGCHLAYKLKNDHDIKIFEKNDKLFQESSFHNQNRLHLGFHYARDYKTRYLCLNSFYKFIDDYGFCVESVEKNYYCIAEKKSIVDYKTYLKIFDDFEYEEVDVELKKIEGCINTGEKYINFIKCSNFFNEELNDCIIHKKITKQDVVRLSREFDMVVDCTNNQLELLNNEDNFFELTLCLIYKKLNHVEFDALTIVDGNFFSIYPYNDNNYVVTDVLLTPIKTFNKLKDLYKFKSTVDDYFVEKKIKDFESKILENYPNFKNDFTYVSYFLSTKTKYMGESSGRYPVIDKKDNIITCFTGKIQGIYIIEEYIGNIINEQKNKK